MKKGIICALAAVCAAAVLLCAVSALQNRRAARSLSDAQAAAAQLREENERLKSMADSQTGALEQLADTYHLPASIFSQTDGCSAEDYFLLYEGFLFDPEKDDQFVFEMPKADYDEAFYERFYYSYADNQYTGISVGETSDLHDGSFFVSGTDAIASSFLYDAVPRQPTLLHDAPAQLQDAAAADLSGYDGVSYLQIDLDGNGGAERIVFLQNRETVASKVLLFDSSWNKLGTIVSLNDGRWAGLSGKGYENVLSPDNVALFDVDNDGAMEILTRVPCYEGIRLAITRFDGTALSGARDIEASVLP